MIDWRRIYTRDGKVDQYAVAGYVDGVQRYTVCRVVLGSQETFEAWPVGNAAICRGPCARAAKQACEDHLAGREARPLVRRSDPDTSHEAARRVTRSGTRADHLSRVVAAVKAHAGKTSAELALLTGLERHEAARRTSDGEREGLLRKGPARKCSVSGRAAVTWHPALTESQRECLECAA